MSAPAPLIHRLFGVDLRSLAALRIATGLTILWVALIWSLDLSAFFTDAGVLPRDEVRAVDHVGRFSLLMFAGGWWAALLLWLCLALGAVALVAGFRPRFAAFVCWVAYLSFVGRNPMIAQGGDMLIPLLLFWMMFLPVGAVFSVDAALDPVDRRRDPPHLSVASVGLLLQVLYVYVIGALLKTGPAWLPNASAVYIALHIDTFVTPAGEILRGFPLVMTALTLFVFAIELFAPILLFFPDRRLFVRSVTLALLMLMHVGFRVFLHIGHFWLASLSSLTAYIPGAVWDWIGERYWRRRQGETRIYYDRDCGFCRKVALILREFFLPRSVPVVPAQDHPEIGPILESEVSWVLVTPDGERLLHWAALAYLMRQSPLLAPLGWLAALYGAVGLGKPTYDLIGRNRNLFGALTRWLTPPRRHAPASPVLSGALCVVIAFCLFWNLQGLPPDRREAAPLPDVVVQAAKGAGLTQYWDMFAPSPPAADGFPILVAYSANGVEDAFRQDGTPVSFDTPDDVLGLFPSHRWRAFLLRASGEAEAVRETLYLRWARRVCREKNEGRVGGDRIERIEIKFLKNTTLGGYEEVIETLDFGALTCPDA